MTVSEICEALGGEGDAVADVPHILLGGEGQGVAGDRRLRDLRLLGHRHGAVLSADLLALTGVADGPGHDLEVGSGLERSEHELASGALGPSDDGLPVGTDHGVLVALLGLDLHENSVRRIRESNLNVSEPCLYSQLHPNVNEIRCMDV